MGIYNVRAYSQGRWEDKVIILISKLLDRARSFCFVW